MTVKKDDTPSVVATAYLGLIVAIVVLLPIAAVALLVKLIAWAVVG